MKRLALLLVLVGCASDDAAPAGLSTAATIHVTAERPESANLIDFGQPTFFVKVSEGDTCFTPDATFGGTWHGVPMPIVQAGGPRSDGSCAETRLGIPFAAVVAGSDAIEVFDEHVTIVAAYPPNALDVRTAALAEPDWMLAAGSAVTFTWSSDIAQGVVPSLCFLVPAMKGSQVLQHWQTCPKGTVAGRQVAFTLPSPLEATGQGQAMLTVGRASGTATTCTGGTCTFDLEEFAIHRAIAMP